MSIKNSRIFTSKNIDFEYELYHSHLKMLESQLDLYRTLYLNNSCKRIQASLKNIIDELTSEVNKFEQQLDNIY